MTRPPVPFVWWRSAYDNLAHALALEEVADSAKGHFAALCTHTAPAGHWTRLTKPEAPVDVVCLLRVGLQLPEPPGSPELREWW